MAWATVQATVLDHNGMPFAYGKVLADFVPGNNPGVRYTYGGNSVPTGLIGFLDSSGTFSISVPKTNEIEPGDGQWKITVISADGSAQATVTTTVTTTTTLTASLGAVAPAQLAATNTPVAAVSRVPSAAMGTVRNVYGKISPVYAGTVTSGNLVGVRGEVNIPSGTTLGGQTYFYGAQGKFIANSTLDNGSGFNCGLFGQLDVSGASFVHTSGYLAPCILDFSTSAKLATDALADMIVTLNTSQCLINSILKTAAKASYLFDLSDLGQGAYIVATAKGSGWTKSLKIKLNGDEYYIPCNPDPA